jgi:hypothetical protein
MKQKLKIVTLIVAFMAISTVPISRAAFPINPKQQVSLQQTVDGQIAIKDGKKAIDLKKEKSSIQQKQKRRAGGKSQLIALLLVVLVGGLGIHRFYLGYTWQGIVQLLTLGGCGIWALIDLIRIITGDLTPKDGPYDKTL